MPKPLKYTEEVRGEAAWLRQELHLTDKKVAAIFGVENHKVISTWRQNKTALPTPGTVRQAELRRLAGGEAAPEVEHEQPPLPAVIEQNHDDVGEAMPAATELVDLWSKFREMADALTAARVALAEERAAHDATKRAAELSEEDLRVQIVGLRAGLESREHKAGTYRDTMSYLMADLMEKT